MKSRKGWLLTREPVPPGDVRPDPLCVIVPSRRVTNKAVDDLVREFHLREFGALWPNVPTWREDPAAQMTLTLRVPQCRYRLTPCEIYG